MKHTTIRLGVFVLFVCVFQSLQAQSLIGAAGDSQSSNTYRLSWSLGELATTTISNSNYTLSQGLHQGIIIEPLPPVLGLDSDNFDVSVYPNPTSKWINISNQSLDLEWSYRLLSQEGKEIMRKEAIKGVDQQIDLTEVASGAYLLQIDQADRFKTLRIIVNH